MDLREWYQKDGEYKPGKGINTFIMWLGACGYRWLIKKCTGICLPKAQWEALVELLPEINQALQK